MLFSSVLSSVEVDVVSEVLDDTVVASVDFSSSFCSKIELFGILLSLSASSKVPSEKSFAPLKYLTHLQKPVS